MSADSSTEVRIPDALWCAVLELFATHPPGVERVVYLDGFPIDESGYHGFDPDATVFVATTVVVPYALLTARNYAVATEAVSAAGRHLRVERMTRVAQVHSHGDNWLEHSPTDDDRAYSQRPGAVSIVVPFHGVNRPGVNECAVHLRTEAGWQRVDADSIIKIIPAVLDHRSTTWTPTQASAQNGGIFSRSRAWAKNAWKRLVRCESPST